MGSRPGMRPRAEGRMPGSKGGCALDFARVCAPRTGPGGPRPPRGRILHAASARAGDGALRRPFWSRGPPRSRPKNPRMAARGRAVRARRGPGLEGPRDEVSRSGQRARDLAHVLALRSGHVRGDRVASQSGRLLRHADRLRGPLVRIQRRPGGDRAWLARRSPTRWPTAPRPTTGTGLASRTQARARATWTTEAPTIRGAISADAGTASG